MIIEFEKINSIIILKVLYLKYFHYGVCQPVGTSILVIIVQLSDVNNCIINRFQLLFQNRIAERSKGYPVEITLEKFKT